MPELSLHNCKLDTVPHELSYCKARDRERYRRSLHCACLLSTCLVDGTAYRLSCLSFHT